MKTLFLLGTCLSLSIFAMAQTSAPISTTASMPVASKVPPLDKSPMDMSYYPADYPMLKTQNKVTQPPAARVVYSRPQRDNRVIFGDLVPYGQVWRLGANEATEIEFFKDIVLGGKKVAKGRYTLYAIPTETKWTLIVNKDTDTWGAFVYDQKKDVVRVDVPVQPLSAPVEAFSMGFTPRAEKGMIDLNIAWDTVGVSVPIDIR